MVRIRMASNGMALAADTLRRTIARFAIVREAIDLHHLGVVNALGEGIWDCVQVHLVTICCDLYSVCQATRYVVQERLGGLAASFSDHPANNQFAYGTWDHVSTRLPCLS